MPLPQDNALVQSAEELLSIVHAAAGDHPGYRPLHAQGLLVNGTFTPTKEASTLTKAPHFNNPSSPITIRYSSSTGIPQIPDTDPNANPRGLAIRFHLPEKNGRRRHTDIITHSIPLFPTRTGQEFVEFLKAVGASSAPGVEHPTPVEQFLGSHPATLRFVQAEKPFPRTFAEEAFFGVNAFKFVSADGKETYVRYRVIPVAGVHHLSPEEVKSKSSTYLFDEVSEHLKKGPIEYKLAVQVAEDGDATDDSTALWPDSRNIVELGTLKLERVVEAQDQFKEQKYIIFDPVPRVDGVEASADPLIDYRAAVYLISGRERRAAKA